MSCSLLFGCCLAGMHCYCRSTLHDNVVPLCKPQVSQQGADNTVKFNPSSSEAFEFAAKRIANSMYIVILTIVICKIVQDMV